MKNVSHKNMCNSGVVQVNVYPPLISLIKSKHDDNSYKDFVRLKLCRGPTPAMLYLYEF